MTGERSNSVFADLELSLETIADLLHEMDTYRLSAAELRVGDVGAIRGEVTSDCTESTLEDCNESIPESSPPVVCEPNELTGI